MHKTTAKSTKKTPSLVGAATGIAIAMASVSAGAETMQQLCSPNGIPCIRDSRGQVYEVAGVNTRQMPNVPGGTWYQLAASTIDGPSGGGEFFYASGDCSGGAWMEDWGILPKPAGYTGTAFVAAAGELQNFYYKSYRSIRTDECQRASAYCPTGGCQGFGAPAAKIQVKTFYPPFTME